MTNNKNDLGDSIKKNRIEKGVTRKELAQKIGVSEVTITRYENGTREPKRETLNNIAKALDVDVFKLMGFDDFLGELESFTSQIEKQLNIDNRYASIPDTDYSNIGTAEIKDILYSTVVDIMYLALNSTSLKYNINTFSDEEIKDIGDFIYDAYQLKVTEILKKT